MKTSAILQSVEDMAMEYEITALTDWENVYREFDFNVKEWAFKCSFLYTEISKVSLNI